MNKNYLFAGLAVALLLSGVLLLGLRTDHAAQPASPDPAPPRAASSERTSSALVKDNTPIATVREAAPIPKETPKAITLPTDPATELSFVDQMALKYGDLDAANLQRTYDSLAIRLSEQGAQMTPQEIAETKAEMAWVKSKREH